MRAGRRTWFPFGSRTYASRPYAPPALRTPAKEPGAGIWDRVSGRTRSVLAAGLRSLKPPLAPGYYEELEEVLLSADLGPAMAARLVAGVRARAPRTREEAAEAMVATALAVMSKQSR